MSSPWSLWVVLLAAGSLVAGCQSQDKPDRDDDTSEPRPRRKRRRATSASATSATASATANASTSAASATSTSATRTSAASPSGSAAPVPPEPGRMLNPAGGQSALADVDPLDLVRPPSAVVTASGLATLVLQRGHGLALVGPKDKVSVHYSGWTRDGKMFDSSFNRGKPMRFGVHQVIPGWREALQLMVEGERRRLWIPAALAYGDKPKHASMPAGLLVFDVEIVKVEKTSEADTPPM